MDSEEIEHVSEIASSKSLNKVRVNNSKKMSSIVKMCVYLKDMECRIPICDMKICEKCPEGFVYCTRVDFIRNMIKKVLVIFLCFLVFLE